LRSSPEPDNGSGEAERERDRRFHAADLCGTRANEPTCRHVDATRNLRCDDSLSVDELDSQYRTGQQQAADQSDERGLQIAHGLRLPSWNPRRLGAEEEHESYPEVESKEHATTGVKGALQLVEDGHRAIPRIQVQCTAAEELNSGGPIRYQIPLNSGW
jgi:hypothetical protein